MDELRQSVESMPSVYEMFAEEARTHVDLFQRVVQRLNSASSESEVKLILQEEAAKLEHRFHLIKGSSGFLKLKTIQTLSAQANEWFKGAAVNLNNAEKLRADLSEVVRRIAEELSLLDQVLQERTSAAGSPTSDRGDLDPNSEPQR